jgi:hypothetical protein
VRLLIWVTLAYAAVLVLAVAGTLLLIWLNLFRARSALQQIGAALQIVADATAPLGGYLDGAPPLTSQLADEVARATTHLQHLNEVLDAMAAGAGSVRAG